MKKYLVSNIFLCLAVLFCGASLRAEPFVRGDANASGEVDITDPICILTNLFLGGCEFSCADAADADDDSEVNMTDAVFMLTYLFSGGAQPAEPFSECGDDPTDDKLGCAAFSPCNDSFEMGGRLGGLDTVEFQTIGDYLSHPAVQSLLENMPRYRGDSPPEVGGTYDGFGTVAESTLPGNRVGDVVVPSFCFASGRQGVFETWVIEETAAAGAAGSIIEGSGDRFTSYTAFSSSRQGPAGRQCQVTWVNVFSARKGGNGNLEDLFLGSCIVGLGGDCVLRRIGQMQVARMTGFLVGDEGCFYVGCTDPEAANFEPRARMDDGRCRSSGCTDSEADNFNELVTIDDGSCIYSGCTDPEAENYEERATVDDDSCTYTGCTDPEAANYDERASADDGSCVYAGCTNPLAENFDPRAEINDGSCIVCEPGVEAGECGGEPTLAGILLEGQVLDSSETCTGEKITLLGFSLSEDPGDYRVFFPAGSSRVEGLLVDIRSPLDKGGAEVFNYYLDVVVPGGATSGPLELYFRGEQIGGIEMTVCPAIYAVTLGESGEDPYIVYSEFLSRFMENTRINVYGLNLADVTHLDLYDDQNNTVRVPSSTFMANPEDLAPGEIPSGYESISFVLNDTKNGNNNFSLSQLMDARENLGIIARGCAGSSNRVEVPVTSQLLPDAIGPVISGMRAPVGVLTGPVRIDYTCYEIAANYSYRMEFQWAVETGPGALQWNSGRAGIVAEHDHDGRDYIICGTVQHKYPGQRLLPAGGLRRTYVWDAPRESRFISLMNSRPDGNLHQRHLKVHFRLRPVRQAAGVEPNNHWFEAPPFTYYWTRDRSGESVPGWRAGEIVESFDTDRNLDSELTDAIWAEPPGSLAGETETEDIHQFGEGRAQVVLGRHLPVDDETDQYYLMDTDSLSISFHTVRGGIFAGEVSSPYILTDDGTPGGNRVDNPGEEFGEFHFANFMVSPLVTVFVQGSRPLVIRCSGGDGDVDETAPVFIVLGLLDLNGGDGADGVPDAAGEGGEGVAGGGDGGNGAFMQFVTPEAQVLRSLTPATAGANGGGGGGSTPAATQSSGNHRDPSGESGGGGGHRTRGGDGALSNRSGPISRYLGAGKGGAARGNALLTPLTAGSGGGGGGAGISRWDSLFRSTGGAGGGGGGGAMRLTARGSVVVTGEVRANGGSGGSGLVTPQAQHSYGGVGGCGSGGSIHLRATGSIDLQSCDVLQVRGGTAGDDNGLYLRNDGGLGEGADGFVRLENGNGGISFCGSIGFGGSTRLTTSVTIGANSRIRVESTATFQDSGLIKIGEEIIAYNSKSATSFTDITRAVAGTVALPHSSGARVDVYPPSTIVPADGSPVLMGAGLIEAPEELSIGAGRDGSLHLRFVQSLDPDTGEPLLDEETGRPVSVYLFDSAASILWSPLGEIVKETAEAELTPGFLDLTEFVIDADVVLRAVGPNPLSISVRGYAEISGTIDVSGGPGGALRFPDGGSYPLPGLGGIPGAGGGAGGMGGTVTHLEVNPENIEVADAGDSILPERIARLNTLPPLIRGEIPVIAASTGGVSQLGRFCGLDCAGTAGGGGGGGNLRSGGNGSVRGLPGQALFDWVGRGGDAGNFPDQRLVNPALSLSQIILVGGLGGGGGGASANVSRAYHERRISGNYPYKGQALYAPGTGGGGGGGVIHIVARNLGLRSIARFIARGGDAYQSIDLAGNGGAGAGGTIFLQVENTISIENGFLFDVSAGRPNRLPPLEPPPGSRRLYEGNVRPSRSGGTPVEGGSEVWGGAGGTASNGRVRVEYSPSSVIRDGGWNRNITTGPFLRDIVESVAVSRIFRVGFGPGQVASTHALEFDAHRVVADTLQQPPGTRAIVVWEGAGDSLDVHGQPGEMKGLVTDPRKLENAKFVRFRVYFQSNYTTAESQSIDSLSLLFRLNPDPDDN